jgi:hypothetical protein
LAEHAGEVVDVGFVDLLHSKIIDN